MLTKLLAGPACSVWEFLFEQPAGSSVTLSPDRGFRDAATGTLMSIAALRHDAIFASTTLAQLCDLKAGVTLALVGQNCVEYPLVMMAAGRIGAVVTTLPVGTSSDELVYFFQTSKTKVVIASESELPRVKSACGTTGIPNSRLWLFGNSDSGASVKKLVALGRQFNPAPYWRLNKRDSCAFLSFTSGTTGKPKAVRKPI